MYRKTCFRVLFIATILSTGSFKQLLSQQNYSLTLTLEEVIETAAEQSPAALIARHNFRADYWQYRSFRAKFLPSVNLAANLGQYNRSLVQLQNYETGEINYIVNDNLQNSLQLSLDQNISLTGGRFSVITSLNRVDNFSPNQSVIYRSQPVFINYSQPIRTFNSLKWEKIVEPKEFEKAKRKYLENLEDIKYNAASIFFEVLSARMNLEMSQKNIEAIELSLRIAEEKHKIGSITYNDLLQLRLQLNNEKLTISDNRTNLDMANLRLRTMLGFKDNVDINLILPDLLPEMHIVFDDVYHRAMENSSFMLDKELSLLSAEQEVERARSSTGLQADLYATLGFTQRGENISGAYKSPIDQEILGLRLSLPILDWGLGKGKVKLARSREEVVKAQVEQSLQQNKQDILIKVLNHNKLNAQCSISAEADSLATASYEISLERFRSGTLSIFDLGNAQRSKDNASQRYVSDLKSYWQSYLNLRRITLFDYLKEEQITVDFDKLIDN